MRHDSTRIALALALAAVMCAPLAWAQKTPKKKKGDTSTPAASASATDTTPPPADTAPAPTSSATETPTEGAGSGEPAAKPAEQVTPMTSTEGTSTDVAEKSGQTYIFIGLRYRGTIIPKFMVNLFVDEGATFYSNTIGIEADFRKDNFSLIPAISYQEYGTGGPVLFLQKGKDASVAGNWSYVDSSMKAIYATADLMWSTKVHKNIDFEYGAGFGLGVVFGDLVTNWVYPNANGPFKADVGPSPAYSPCQTVNDGTGCRPQDHQNSSVAKVGGYTEPSWFNGGSKPNFFPWIGIPQFGLRFKPVKQFEARLQIGFSLTGFWFGLSGDYGLEKPEKK